MVLKDKIPLVNIPTLKANRTENNGKLLRKPQKRQLAPINRCYESPTSSPEPEEEELQNIEQLNARLKSAQSVNASRAGQVTPYGPPPPTEADSIKHRANRRAILHQIPSMPGESTSEPVATASSHVKTHIPEEGVSLNRVLLKTRVHAGPDPLHTRLERRPQTMIPFHLIQEKGPSEQAYDRSMNLGTISVNDPALIVKSVFRATAKSLNIPVDKVETVIYSRANFKRLTQMIHEQLLGEVSKVGGKLNKNNLNAQIPSTELPYRPSSHAVSGSRIPQKQILLQMAAILTEQIRSTMEGNQSVRAVIRSFPKWNPNTPLDEQPKAEIVLYEEGGIDEEDEEEENMQQNKRPTASDENRAGVLLKTAPETHFMDSRRTNSPFDVQGENGLTMTDIAVLDALVTGGAVLSLKAHFIDTLPEIAPIYSVLRYINLSFNNFTSVPNEVLMLCNLEVLKLRNNPIREIPDDIRRLQYLRTLEISFCLVTYLPDGLFTLGQLQYLDLSYNKLTILPDSMRKLKCLQVLFVEGNQLPALPAGCLSLSNLRYIRVRNNFMHPIFWPDYTRNNNPQRLEDLAGLLYKQMNLGERYGRNIPPKAKEIFSMTRRCDCCHGPLLGNGLTLIRPGGMFGVKNVPFMFKSCSHYCARLFMKNKDNLANIIYADSDSET